MATSSTPTTTRKDPLPVFCFKVQFDNLPGNVEGFFKSVSGLKFETEVVPISAGGANDTTFQLPGATKWGNLVFKQGFTKSSALISWRQQWLQGTLKHRVVVGAAKPALGLEFHVLYPARRAGQSRQLIAQLPHVLPQHRLQ